MSDNDSGQHQKFLELLDFQYSWPDYYLFRFVVQTSGEESFMDLLAMVKGVEKIAINASKTGKFKSISFRVLITNSKEVISIYTHFQNLPGTIRI
jgi:hypothetical protein